eukprot:gene220-4466_t
MFWKVLFLLTLTFLQNAHTQGLQRLCDEKEPQMFPSFCKHNNPYVVPYYLTNLNHTLTVNDSKVHCDTNNINSDCYSILKIRVVEISLDKIERYFVFSMGNGRIAVLPFNNETEESREVFQVFDTKFEFMDAAGKGPDYYIIAIHQTIMKIMKVPNGNLDDMITEQYTIPDVLKKVKIFFSHGELYVALLYQNLKHLQFFKIDNYQVKNNWIFDTEVFDFGTTLHFGEFSPKSMTITGAGYNRTLITLTTKYEIKILEFSEKVLNLNVNFGDKTSLNSFYFSNNEITAAHLLDENVRRINQTRSNCSSIFGDTRSQNIFLIIATQNQTTGESNIMIRNQPEFANLVRIRETTVENPVTRKSPFRCWNGYEDSQGRCKIGWTENLKSKKRVLKLSSNYFGIERQLITDPIQICEYLKKVDYTLYLVCRNVIARQIQCELNFLQGFGIPLLKKFWFHHIFAVQQDEVEIFGAQFLLNHKYALLIEKFNEIPIHSGMQDFQITPNGQHLFVTFSRKKWEIDSIKRYGEICNQLDKDPKNPFLIFYTEICNQELPRHLDVNLFGQYISMCFPGVHCPSSEENLIYFVREGFYTLLSRTMQECEPGYFCFNGFRSKCPYGFKCPRSKMGSPELCLKQDKQITCFAEGTINEKPCPEGTICDTPSLPPMPISPGYYLTTEKDIKKCQPGDWCSLGRFSNNGTDLKCPENTFCPRSDIIQPNICYSNISSFRYCPEGSIKNNLCPAGYFCLNQTTKKNCSISEYCPEGTFVPKPCPAGHYCPTPKQSIICPQGYFCALGSHKPTPCVPFISICPEGSIDEGNFFIFALTVIGVMGLIALYYLAQLLDVSCKAVNICLRRKDKKEQIDDKFRIDIGFNNLSVQLRNGKKILQNVCGEFKNGRLTAIMGLSGSGKTTFLTTLSGRQYAGRVSGDVLFNGKAVSLSKYDKLFGFVPQEDIMLRMMTVYETLYFAARTKLSWRKSNAEITKIVDDVLEKLDLMDVKDSIIGDEETRGISGGQRKRVNIGIELVSDPTVLFLDEPTSGLDSAAANDVCKNLKKIAETGIPVVTVIHQPRYEIFSMIDDILLLGKGGRVVFLGPRDEALHYFENLGFHCPEKVNPADFLMDVTNGTIPRNGFTEFQPTDLFDLWDKNPLTFNEEDDFIHIETEALLRGRRKTEPLTSFNMKSLNNEVSKKNPSTIVQFWQVFKRAIIQQMREPIALILEFILLYLPGCTLGFVFSGKEYIGPLPEHIIALCPPELKNLCGAPLDDTILYVSVLLTCSISLVGSMTSLKTFGNEKVVFIRESIGGLYTLPYFLAKNFSNVLNILLGPLLYMSLFYTLASPRAEFWEIYVCLLLLYFNAFAFGYLVSIVFDQNVARLASVILILFFQMFSGGGPTLPDFEEMSPPMKYLPNVSFLRWGMESLYCFEITKFSKIYNIQYSLETWGYHPERFWMNFGILIGIGVLLRVISFFSLMAYQPNSIINILFKWFLDLLFLIKFKILHPLYAAICIRKKDDAEKSVQYEKL